ncbi:39S ribosomal protein L51, mitochondrial-like [Anneissia japonica]|uniref:39S ribosomal protein L51, mitochondrial-like n=1 Tax=Anneissia japonica TaxID=1529436 RepID=UPI00142552EF|nr:39S ribosomal protein L51, mitochondrial-like [Anneissia japonica]
MAVLFQNIFRRFPRVCYNQFSTASVYCNERPSTESLIKWDRLPVPKNTKKDRWDEKHSLFGENDCKDVLGDGSYQLKRNIKVGPFWLRGWRGNEMQRLIRKRKAIGPTLGPKAHEDIRKRIKYLYKRFNKYARKGQMWD